MPSAKARRAVFPWEFRARKHPLVLAITQTDSFQALAFFGAVSFTRTMKKSVAIFLSDRPAWPQMYSEG